MQGTRCYTGFMQEENNNQENAKQQMRKGLLVFSILLAIAKEGKAYTTDILQELQKDNLLVVEGTLYPLLSRLKSDEVLSYTWQESPAGPPRKYYELTQTGKKLLSSLTQTWAELNTSINSLVQKYEKNN